MRRASEPEEEGWGAFDAALRAVEREEPEPELRAQCLPAERPFRVLAVDDEPSILRLIEHNLTQAGYAVETARDGREALARVESDRPDVVVLDVMMPGPDGFQVLGTLKGDPRTADIPVVMLTAQGGDEAIRHGWQEGTDWYMTKPFNPAALVSVVNRITDVLGTPESPPPLRRWLK